MSEAVKRSEILDLIQKEKTEAYNKGLEDAWKLVQRLYNTAPKEIEQIFGTDNLIWDEREFIEVIVKRNTPQEALAKLEAYEKDTFKVGDIVQCKLDNSITIIVTNMCDDKTFNGINANGSTFSGRYCCDWEKTGKHIDISSILEQIGGGE